jgi:CelD/BcsL family acetyltransferase involved in cellulose biosynthesis
MKSVSARLRPSDCERCAGAANDELPALPRADGTPDAAPVEYSIVSTRDGFDALAADWDALFARAGTGAQLFQGFNWLWHWCNHYLDEASTKQSLAIVVGRRAGRLVLVWPLVRERGAGVVQLTAMGSPVSQYSDAIVEPSADVAELLRVAWDTIVAEVKPDLVWLQRVRDDAIIAPLMREIGAIAAQRMEAPYIDLSQTPDFEAYLARQSPHMRKKNRAAERRLAKLDVAFCELAESDAASEMSGCLIDMKRRQLGDRGLVSPAFADSKMGCFFHDAAAAGAHYAGVGAVSMTLDRQLAAGNIVVGYRDRMVGHVFTYESKHAKESVGVHVLHQTMKHAIAGGYRTFDLLAPADEYNLRAADGTVGVTNWAVPLTVKGHVFMRLVTMTARPLAKALIERIPARLRTALARRYYGTKA